MAVPIITTVHPNRAYTQGGRLVRILGLDFAPRVEVRFGDVQSARVLAVNHAMVFAEVPRGQPGEVEVSVQNLDAFGAPIEDELARSPQPFSYARVLLTDDSTLLRVTAALILMLREQTIDNVSTGHMHTDYDASTGDTYNLTEVQSLPALVLVGPEVAPAEQQENQQVQVPAFGVLGTEVAPYLADLRFSVTGLSAYMQQTLNLQNAVIAAVRRHPYVELLRDPTDPAQGSVQFQLDFDLGGAPSIEATSDDNNVRTFALRLVIRQVPLGEVPGFAEGPLDVVPPVGDCGVELTFTQKL